MKILLIEDNPGDARLVQEMLREAPSNFVINTADKLRPGLEFLAGEDVDVVLLDLGLPDSNGLETFTRLQAEFPHIPVVIMTGSNDEALGVKAVQLGAQDYLVKGQVVSRLLQRALVYAIERKKTDEVLKKRNEEIQNLVEDLKVHQEELEAQAEELRQTQQEARESRDKYLDLYDYAPVGYLTLGKGGTVLEANLTAASLLGLEKNKLIRSRFTRFIAPDSQDTFYFHMKKTFKTGTRQRSELLLRRKDGSIFYAKLESIVVHAGGSPDHIRTTLSDISERKRMQEQLIIQERLAYLGKMSGTIAHEVRNPLATVDASVFYLERNLKDTGGKTKEHLRRMRNSVTYAANIIEKLLEMARMKPPELIPTDLSALVAGILLNIRVVPAINVVSDGQKEIKVMADEEQLRLAIGNLLRNAAEAMPDGGTLTVSVRMIDSLAEVSVRDTGPGIAPDNLSRIFEPLFTTKPGGVGFGLALAKTVVERHCGNIEVKSKPGKGATFIIRLPLHTEGKVV